MAGCTAGNFLGGFIADKVGKKLTILASNTMAYAFWVLISFSDNKKLLYFTYSVQGFFGAIAFNCVGK